MLQMTHPAILQIILRYDKTLFHMVSGSRPKQFLNQNFTANLRHTLHVVVRFIIRYKVLFNYISSFIPNKMYISEWMFQLFLHHLPTQPADASTTWCSCWTSQEVSRNPTTLPSPSRVALSMDSSSDLTESALAWQHLQTTQMFALMYVNYEI